MARIGTHRRGNVLRQLKLARPWVAASDPLYLIFSAVAVGLIFIGFLVPGSLSSDWGVPLALVAILATGLPHGVFDIHIALHSSLGRGGASRFSILFLYVGIGAVGGIAWIIAPALLVSLFLLLSVWHFSGDFLRLGRGLSLMIASSILLMPMISYPVETQAIFSMLMPEADSETLIRSARWGWPILFLTFLGLAYRSGRDPLMALAAALAIIAGFIFSPIIAFALYFAGLHGPCHIRKVLSDLPTKKATFSEAALYVVITFALLGIMAVLWGYFGAGAPLTGALFGLLIVLTLPHMAIVERWNRAV